MSFSYATQKFDTVEGRRMKVTSTYYTGLVHCFHCNTTWMLIDYPVSLQVFACRVDGTFHTIEKPRDGKGNLIIKHHVDFESTGLKTN